MASETPGFTHGEVFRCLVLAVVASVLLATPIIGVVAAGETLATEGANPIADYWRSVRAGVAGYSAVKGQETGVLIQSSGQKWRQLRNGPIRTYGAWLMALTLFTLGCFYLWRGSVKLTQPRTGHTLQRWNLFERILHWLTATVFFVLTLTGLSLLYGRALLIPLVGHSLFSVYADWAKLLHNVLGPLLIVGLVLMFIAWIKDNLPNRLDIEWFKAFGGMIGDRHPSAQRINAGEKAWFWLLAFGGVGVCVSGLVLDFPNFGQNRILIQSAHLVHVVLAILLIVGALGHIYIGTIGTEGVLEGMARGRVDTTWAKQHHDLWYAAMEQNGQLPESSAGDENQTKTAPGVHPQSTA